VADVTIYSSGFCPYCIRAKMLLETKEIAFDELNVDREPSLRAKMQQLSGRTSVPQIWVGERHVGGFTDLWALESNGELDEWLASV